MEMEQFKQTKFDSMITNRTMQLVKAIIPYINNNFGTFIGIYIKFIELQNAAKINSNGYVAAMNTDKHLGMENLFEDIKDFLGDEERETIDTMTTMMEMMKTMSSMNMDDDMMQGFMNSMNNGENPMSDFMDTMNNGKNPMQDFMDTMNIF